MAQTAQRRRAGRSWHGLGPLRGLGGLGLFVGLLGRQHPLRYHPCLFAHKLKRKFRCRGGTLLIWFKSQIYHHIIVRMLMQCHLNALHPRANPLLAWFHTNKIIPTQIPTCKSIWSTGLSSPTKINTFSSS